jgi:mono/diheme cytochrome c family protein
MTPTPYLTATFAAQATVEVGNEADPLLGKPFYDETCAGCHGFDGEGIEGLGLPLVDSPLVLYATDLQLMIFLRTGRPADHPDNTLGVTMPPSGGRPDWDNETFTKIIAYLRYLRDSAQSD